MASSFVYDIALAGFGNGRFNWSGLDTSGFSFFVTLVSNGYVPANAHSYASNFSGNELSSVVGSSFTAGHNGTVRILLTGRSVFSNLTSHQAEFRAADVSWQSANIGVAHAFIIGMVGTTNGDSPLIAYVSTGGFPIATNGGNLVLSFANSGVFLTQPA